jgi:hypothetical protein
VFGGKTLLQVSLVKDDNIDPAVWLDFDKQMDIADPKTKKDRSGNQVPAPRRGALPVRVWQMYMQMIAALSSGDMKNFITAGGTMSTMLVMPANPCIFLTCTMAGKPVNTIYIRIIKQFYWEKKRPCSLRV